VGPDPTQGRHVVEAMAAIGHLSSESGPPAWIDRHQLKTLAPQVVSCHNGLLDLDTRTLHPHTPALFNLVNVPFPYEPDALEPTAWLDFWHRCGVTTKSQSHCCNSTSATSCPAGWNNRKPNQQLNPVSGRMGLHGMHGIQKHPNPLVKGPRTGCMGCNAL
jgi:hypothetical protein